MDHQTPRRVGGIPLQHDHGAALLLAVYLVSLTLLLLGGVSLQRTTTEVRSAEVSRDLHQAFWLAEGALDSYTANTKRGTADDLKGNIMSTPLGTWEVNEVVPRPDQPFYSEIFDKNDGQVITSGKQRALNLYQRSTKQVVGEGIAEGRTQRVSASVVEEAPLRGIWANGTIAVGGGRGINPGQMFLSGDLHSQLGTVVSTIESATPFDKLMFDGLIKVPPEKAAAPLAEKLEDWAGKASNELKSIKEGYKLIEGFLQEDLSEVGGSYSDVDFISSAATSTSEHIKGSLSVGLSGKLASFKGYTPSLCANTVYLTSSKVVVKDNFQCNNGSSNTPGLSCGSGTVSDLDPAIGSIWMCANAVVPASPRMWVDTMMGSEPELVFQQPTTLVLSGGAQINTVDPTTGKGTPLASPFSFLTTDIVETAFHVQANWNVSFGAKLSGMDYFGKPLPVNLYQQENSVLPGVKPGLVFLKPGDQFQGSVYAPNSLVLVRSRTCAAANTCSGLLQMPYIVGNEVVIELESDQLQIGSQEPKPEDVTTSLLSWSNQ